MAGKPPTRESRGEPRIVIIGAGPTGLGAAYRLRELGYTNFVLLEAADHVGGLASSERSANGFTYDIGGHVLFSHYPYFDALFDRLMGDEFQELVREAWVWMEQRFLPYPFQNNIRHLSRETVLECVMGLIEAQKQSVDLTRFANFEELIYGVFGGGIARHFMLPYNFKVWAHPPSMMNREWIGERVSVVDVARVLRNVIMDSDDAGWGPNSTFKYPLYGGTGGLFGRITPYVDSNLRLSARVAAVDQREQFVELTDGTREHYDFLLSTMPMDLLVNALTRDVPDAVRAASACLRHSGSFIVGVGVNRPAPSSKCWMYFPESDTPFYRVTYLSNYSPEVVPDASRQHSLLAEISFSEYKPEERSTVIERTLDGMLNTQLLLPEDVADIADVHVIERAYTYPLPGVERDGALCEINPYLESLGIFSRGRFGAWRYEVGNMDHSVAQGVEWVNRALRGERTDELTYLAKRGC
ncbi:MAG: FAD-dependent oxidoreductase [Gemmatimonadota bacterium]|nr:FAD-dependent oxidoreductase [Gemmatimonadota bacterium]